MTVRSVGLEAPVPEARSRHTAHMIGDVLHLVGGYDGGKPCAGDVFTLDCTDPLAMESADASGRTWTTVGVSANIIDASFDALIDAISWKLLKEGMRAR